MEGGCRGLNAFQNIYFKFLLMCVGACMSQCVYMYVCACIFLCMHIGISMCVYVGVRSWGGWLVFRSEDNLWELILSFTIFGS